MNNIKIWKIWNEPTQPKSIYKHLGKIYINPMKKYIINIREIFTKYLPK